MTLESLRAEVEAGRVVVVMGSGVTAATTAGSPAGSWLGLIRHGVTYAQEQAGKDDNWAEWVDADLTRASREQNALVSAAEKIVEALGGTSSPMFLSWLTAALETLSIQDDRLIKAIESLHCPVTTTNYDLLYEKITGRSYCTWQDNQFALATLRGTSTDVLHWHGAWRSPSSVILSAQSYGAILSDTSAQELQRAVGLLNTMLFVGIGSGLEDPNFGNLAKWLQATAPGVQHYRLCRDSELEGLGSGSDLRSAIKPISFGAEHSDLIPFLHTLSAQSTIEKRQWAAAANHSVDAIDQRIRSHLIIADNVTEPDSRLVEELLIAPVILPIPSEQFVAHEANPDAQILEAKPCDATHEALRDGITVIVGEELSGLTTTLQWMLEYRATHSGSGTPVFIDFLGLTSGMRPVEREIRKQLRPWIIGGGRPDAQLPALSIAIDNASSRPLSISRRVIEDLIALPTTAVQLGCRSGAEVELLELLSAAGLNPQVRYIGPLSARDVRQLAGIVRPREASDIARRALVIANREHLSRTPFTMSLLICALIVDEAFSASASETTLLDSYVSLLLGRGDPHDDARFDFDAVERETMLSLIAGHMVERRAGSIAEGEAVSLLQKYFTSVDWVEDPFDVLNNLRSRRIISIKAGQIRFVQSSFLHLFAAKYAITSEDFRRTVFSKPLFYGPILKHYAALQRGDNEALRVVGELVIPSSPNSPPAGAFADWGSVKNVIDISGILAGYDDEQDSSADSNPSFDDKDDDLGMGLLDIGLYSGHDLEPFPLVRFEDMPPLQQAINAVHLASNVLRDSELVTDLALKTTVLINVFGMWADFVGLIESDESYQSLMRNIVSITVDILIDAPNKRPSIVDDVMSTLGAIAAYGGMATTLSSRKLFRTVQRAVSDPRMQNFPGGQILAALFSLDVLAPGFGELVLNVTRLYPDAPAVSVALHRLAFAIYIGSDLSRDDEENLATALTLQMVRAKPFSNASIITQQVRELRGRRRQQTRIMGGASNTEDGLSAREMLELQSDI